jgi:hypothetical protein
VRERVAAGLGLLLVAISLGVLLSHGKPRLATSNSQVRFSAIAVPLPAGRRRCQVGEYVPHDAAAVRLFAGTPRTGGGPVELVVRGQGGARRGRLAHLTTAPVRFPLSPLGRDINEGTVCLRNLGRAGIAFAGNKTSTSADANGKAKAKDDFRLDYLRPGRESWWQIAPTVARRAGLHKASVFGTWTLWAALGLAILLWVPALVLVLGRGER